MLWLAGRSTQGPSQPAPRTRAFLENMFAVLVVVVIEKGRKKQNLQCSHLPQGNLHPQDTLVRRRVGGDARRLWTRGREEGVRSAQFRRRKRCLWRIPSTRPRPGDACKANLASMSRREKAALFEQHPECSFHTALLLLCRPFFSLRGSAGVRCRVSLTRFQLTLLPISTSSLSPNLRRIVVFSLAPLLMAY